MGEEWPANLRARSLDAARALATQSSGFSRTPRLVLARQLVMLVQAAVELSGSTTVRSSDAILEPLTSSWLASDIRPAELVHALLEAEELLDALVFDEAGLAAPDPERWRALRKGLRDVVRILSGRLTPLEAERERRRLTDVLEALPEAILLVDGDERVSYANSSVRDAYGVEPASMVGRSLADVLTEPALLLHLEDTEAFLDATLRLLDADTEPYEDVFRQANGSAFVRRSLPAGENGRVLVTTNVTRLRRRNQDVEQRLARPPEPAPSGPLERRQGSRRLQLLQGGCAD